MSATSTTIAPETTIGTASLTVSDLGRSREFYEDALGLSARELDNGDVVLSAGAGGEPLLELHGDSAAQPLDPRLTGLFHFAVLVPSREDLSQSLWRLAHSRWPLSGASDHLVSEALYLNDPDGNGIEIYRDRPREEWRTDEHGQLQMATLPLDLDSLAAETGGPFPEGEDPGVPPGTRLGHMHLQVSELQQIEAFYAGVLGFDVVVRSYPGALFVSAGGYHHHIGLNTWNSRGASAPPPGAIGLRSFDVQLPDEAALAEVLARVDAAGLPTQPDGGATVVHDPSGNAVRLRVAAG